MADLTIATRQGRVQGALQGGVRRWLGVGYAQAARLAAPQPPASWEGVQDALKMAPQCPQNFGGPARRAKLTAPDFAEDCLALNIWAPVAEPQRPRPVLVWIHGGAFVAGGCNAYDGSELAELGDMVVVGVNYRLGVLGFVNFGEALGLPDIPSNLGLRDQIAALEWVRDNIEAFGGDPARVTIAGESAGSISVSLLMLCQKAWPLFSGAILQSGAVSTIHDRATALETARRYAELLGLDQSGRETLNALDLTALFEAQATVDAERPNGIPAAPWFDGDLLPESLEAARSAPHAPVPLLAGYNKDEIRLFEVMPGSILPEKRDDLEALLHQQLPAEQARSIIAQYPNTTQGRRALATDLTFGMPTSNFATRHAVRQPTWFYRFDYAHPWLGAAHGLDLAFIWPFKGFLAALVRGGPYRGRRKALAERMKAHWAHFVNAGQPKADWPGFTPEGQDIRLLNLQDRTVSDPERDRRLAWAGQDVAPRLGRRSAES